jgi:hypothetical protein
MWRRLPLVLAGAVTLVATAPAAASASTGAWSFVSAPNLHPPRLRVLRRRAGVARGDFLVANDGDTGAGAQTFGQSGPMLLDSRAQPVWFEHAINVLDFGQEIYQGKPVLVMVRGFRVLVLNEHYRTVASVRARAPWTIDGHDASITGGNVWVTVTRQVKDQDLTAYGGPTSGNVLDCGLQEYQLSTGHLIRTWDALNPGGQPNVPLSASETRVHTLPGPHGGRTEFDAYHLNAVQALPRGDLLVSMRNTWSVYLLDPATGQVLWTLGGKRSTFTLGRGAQFRWQHDAKLLNPADGGLGSAVRMTLFNDNNDTSTNRPSAGLVLRLNTTTHRAVRVAAYHHHPALHSQILGSMELLPNGNALVGWGSEPYFTEFSNTGRPLLDVEWPAPVDQTYRAQFTDSWVGTPYYPPRGAVRARTVYASWNGATQVSQWEVMAGSSTGKLTPVASHARSGFETPVKLSRTYRRYEVRALSSDGNVLGTSKGFS